MSAEETVLNLFDEYWFEQGVFASKPSLSDQFHEDEETAGKDEDQTMNLMTTTTVMRKSYSDQFLTTCSSLESGTPSPKSVLGPHLQTILSGKEVESFDGSLPEEDRCQIQEPADTNPDRVRVTTRRRRRKSGSRSLSELEFEELKGFMDLGFVFSDEDRDSRLVSIIPGLQRMGKNVEEGGVDTTSVSRPYLSEAWDCVGEGERVKNPLMDWRIPSFGNEMELKDHLKFWAHTVASTVR